MTEIAKNIEFGCIRIVMPKSLKSIGKGCFNQTVSFDCQYNNATLVIYGVEIDLAKIFLSNIDTDWKMLGLEIVHSHNKNMEWDRQLIGDAAYEYYNKEEPKMINAVINEINCLLTIKECEFRYLPFETQEKILLAMLEDNDDKSISAYLDIIRARFAERFEIVDGVLKSFHSDKTEKSVSIPENVRELDLDWNKIDAEKVFLPSSVKVINGSSFSAAQL